MTTEKLQYWGGFFDSSLKLNIKRDNKKRLRKKGLVDNTFFYPNLLIYDSRKKVVDYVESNFGGLVSKDKKERRRQATKDLWVWSNNQTINTNALRFLETIQPYTITQAEQTKIMIEFLKYKTRRQEEFPGSLSDHEEEERKRLLSEQNFYQRFRAVRETRSLSSEMPSFARLAGIIDASGHISIDQSYDPMLYVPSKLKSDLEPLQEHYHGGSIYRKKEGEWGIEMGYYWTVSSRLARACLQDIQPHLVLLQPQASLAIDFQNTVEDLYTGVGPYPRGKLADVLSPQQVEMLREGYRHTMITLNEQLAA